MRKEGKEENVIILSDDCTNLHALLQFGSDQISSKTVLWYAPTMHWWIQCFYLPVSLSLIQVSMSIMRLGFVTCYLADPLVRGFTTGAAFHVFTSQFNKLFGVPVPRYSGILSIPKVSVKYIVPVDPFTLSALVKPPPPPPPPFEQKSGRCVKSIRVDLFLLLRAGEFGYMHGIPPFMELGGGNLRHSRQTPLWPILFH